jgi:hypothetical protein
MTTPQIVVKLSTMINTKTYAVHTIRSIGYGSTETYKALIKRMGTNEIDDWTVNDSKIFKIDYDKVQEWMSKQN